MERIRAKLYAVVPLILLSVTFNSSLARSALGDSAGEAVIHVEDAPRYLGWDDGSLTVKLKGPTGKLKLITLKFSGEHKENLRQLLIVTTDWSVDITSYVAQRPFPFISRATIVVPRWTKSGDISDVYFNMPYSKDGRADGCMIFEIAISLGKIVMNDQSPARPDRCAP
jgi:hypothetical protein